MVDETDHRLKRLKIVFYYLVFQLSPKAMGMHCKHCDTGKCIKKGKRSGKQMYRCKTCLKYQQQYYSYKRYDVRNDRIILELHARSVNIRGIASFLRHKPQTIIRRMKHLSQLVKRPMLNERNQVYELDEMWTFVGKNIPENHIWITYAINRRTRQIVDVIIGKRTSENLKKIVEKLKRLSPSKIKTDGLPAYRKLIYPIKHHTSNCNYRIERSHLNIREHVKRTARGTISFSRNLEMLKASILLYFQWNNWQMWRLS